MSFWKNLSDSANDILTYSRMFINKNGPTIAVVGGIALGIASTIYACAKTLDAPEIIEEHKAMMAPDECSDCENANTDECHEACDTENRADKVKVYFTTAGKFVKLYWLPATGLVCATALELWGFHKISSLNAKLVSVNAALTAVIGRYRKDVADVVGDDMERMIFEGKNFDILDDNDNVVGTHVASEFGVPNEYGAFSMVFDKSWPGFDEKSAIMNYFKVASMQEFVQNRVRRNGVCTFNEMLQFNGAPAKSLKTDGYLWGFAPKEGQDKSTYTASFGLANIKAYENGPFGPPDDPRIDMCLPLVWIGDVLPNNKFMRR